jgi:flagellar export protein FliJ
MKAFRFSLQRVLDVRRAQEGVEKMKYERLLRDLAAIEFDSEEIRSETAGIRRTLMTQPTITSGEMSTFPAYLQRNKQRLLSLAQAKHDLAITLNAQRAQVLEAERSVKLLEKLRTRRLEAWITESQNEQEAFASDAYLARWTFSR